MILVRGLISVISARIAQRPLHEWLTQAEQNELATWRNQTRIEQWLAGRWLAKQETRCFMQAEVCEIEIVSRDAFGRSSSPRVYVDGRAWSGSLSISHSGDHVVVAIEPRPGHRIGVDVVLNQDIWTDEAMENWFTKEEQAWIRADDDQPGRAARIWAAKEAAYKAFQRGESFIPRDWPALEWLNSSASSQVELIELGDAVIVAISTVAKTERQIA